jgi:hypothetical protein
MTCTIQDCTTPAWAKGLCNGHYQKQRRDWRKAMRDERGESHLVSDPSFWVQVKLMNEFRDANRY